MSLPFNPFSGKTDLFHREDVSFDFDLDRERSKSLEHTDRFTVYEKIQKSEKNEENQS